MKRSTIIGILLFVTVIYSFKNYSEEIVYPVPTWAKTAVWYQIFPERFWNGDSLNDPQPIDMAGGWPYFIPPGWQNSPWASDWYKLQPWEENIPWHKHFDWAKAGEVNFGATAGLRRYGGDLQGVLDRLDHIENLGITAIYFNPLFESPSLHKYDATMYHHIDNNFGPNPAKDREVWAAENPGDLATWQWTSADSLFLKLIEECHRRGIKVVIDGVFNHTGNMFWAFQDVQTEQQQSRYKDWYTIHQWDDPATEANEFRYEGWNGVSDLPEVREDENGFSPAFRDHVFAIVKRWMDPNGDGDPSDGIDGWRLDVAEKVGIEFWKEFYRYVKEINPQAYITGELWWEDWNENKMFNAAPWFNGAFDAVMNYRFARAIKEYIIDDTMRIDTKGFVDSLQAVYKDYRWDNVLVCQNLMDSHDVDRLASQIVNPDRWYDHDATAIHHEKYSPRKPNAREIAKQRMIIGIQMTLPGAPMIYYGDEVGMWGGDDPDCRKPMVWPEFSYEAERSHPRTGFQRPVDSVEFDESLFAWYRQVIGLRHKHPQLSLGEIEFLLPDSDNGVLGYTRTIEGESIYVFFNNSENTQSQTLTLPANLTGNVSLESLLNETVIAGDAKRLPATFQPYEIMILKEK